VRQVVYCSQAADTLGAEDVFRIVQISARNNVARQLTGFLSFGNGWFVQLLEGPSEEIDRLLSTLADDERHGSLTVVSDRTVPGRRFAKWRMQRLHDPGELRARLGEALSDYARRGAVLTELENMTGRSPVSVTATDMLQPRS
jgi:hypothetical protein